VATTFSTERIERSILIMRGHKVMLDSDLAVLYGITVGRVNEAVKRNRDRFPGDFMFQLTPEEFRSLRSQIVTSNLKSQIAISSHDWGGRRHPPFAFTEQGVAMNSVPLTTTRTLVRISTIISPHCFGSRARGRSSRSGPCFFRTRR
jgi:hypothetical protein